MVIRGACALGGNHRRAQRPLRRTRLAESRAVVRLADSLQDQATDANVRFEHFAGEQRNHPHHRSHAIDRLPGFCKRMNWFLENRKDLASSITCAEMGRGRRLLAVPSRQRLERVLSYLLDEKEFFSAHGIRSLSRVHRDQPYVFRAGGMEWLVDYVAGESTSGAFGGNSNWRGPIWFPNNYLLIEALERYGHFYGESLKVECPVGSGVRLTLNEVAHELSRRLASIFAPGVDGRRPCHGDDRRFSEDPHWRDLLLFHEYFDGDTGRGMGANHQTGWTALVVRCLENLANVQR